MNKNKIASIFIATSIFTTTVLGGSQAFAASNLFSDNFEKGTSKWTTTKGKWTTSSYNGSKVYKQSDKTVNAISKAGEASWTNYSVESEITVDSFNSGNRVMLCGRFTDINNHYAVAIKSDRLELRKRVNGVTTTLKTVSMKFETKKTYKIKLELNGKTIKAYVNGSVKATATDSAISKGAISVFTAKTAAKYDNVVVKSIDGSTSTDSSNDTTSNGSNSSDSTSNGSSNSSTSTGQYGNGTGATANGTTITVTSSGTTLEKAISQAKSGDTILIKGTVKSGSVKLKGDNITIKGESGAKIDFSSTSSGGRGITITGKNNTIQDLEIYNAKDNAIYVDGGSYNRFENLDIHDNADTGLQISNGGANNYMYNCYSHHNYDSKGENPDGFAVKLHSGEGNVFEKCKAEYNVDDGWDFYAAHGAVTLVDCEANYNGEVNGVTGDGNGFKLGGVDNKESGKAAHLDPLNHLLINCSAKGNKKNGFDRNNQSGVVTMKNCVADGNEGKNYNWPLKGKPSALGYEVTFGKAIIEDCTSKNGSNNIKGATLKGNCIGF
ncbi:putative secreted protein [Clostridium bornimense]|uniref:Putative secreted protein n=1 Tax=Clostridium bornimense TaxID=1216932 RepID=W6SJS5_9CLOT|nr:right-handed parallel beta-helix repeat-containing protein [Clostridium bornimense]CDM69960.1 putative secreted protein [Clostridium bornimense]